MFTSDKDKNNGSFVFFLSIPHRTKVRIMVTSVMTRIMTPINISVENISTKNNVKHILRTHLIVLLFEVFLYKCFL